MRWLISNVLPAYWDFLEEASVVLGLSWTWLPFALSPLLAFVYLILLALILHRSSLSYSPSPLARLTLVVWTLVYIAVWTLCAYSTGFSYEFLLRFPMADTDYTLEERSRLSFWAHILYSTRVVLLAGQLVLLWDNLKLKSSLSAFNKSNTPGPMSMGLSLYVLLKRIIEPRDGANSETFAHLFPNASNSTWTDVSAFSVLFAICWAIHVIFP